ncbi:MAG: sugar-binding transcriptional regulator [Acetivibrionales bacterium]
MNDKKYHKLSTLAEVATLYYEKNMKQQDIAERLNISRTRISRLIQEAREKGVVKITINYNLERHYDLEDRLKDKFGLKEAYVLNNRGKTKQEIAKGVYNLAATVIQKKLKANMIVGITWGKTVASAISEINLDSLVPIDIVQLMGSIDTADTAVQFQSPQEIICRLAEKTGGRPHFLNMPFIVTNTKTRKDLYEDSNNARILNMALFCDMVITSIGTLQDLSSSASWLGYMNKRFADDITEKGGIGSLFGRFFDKDGNEIDCVWNRLCTGLKLDQLKKINDVICIISSVHKAEALRATLKARNFNILVVDGTTATAVLNPLRNS